MAAATPIVLESTSANHLTRGSGRLIACAVDDLHPHPSIVRHNLTPSAHEMSMLSERGEAAFRDPLTITQDNAILDGYAQWQLARTQGRQTLLCHQHEMTEEESLLWLLQRQQRSAALNPFSRILLALELEPWFRQQARSNQQRGGQCKGSSNLTEADRLDVRVKVAAAAGVSVGNVSKVKHLLQAGHPDVVQAVREGEVSIHCASEWLKPPEKQLDRLQMHRMYLGKSGISSVVDALLKRHQTQGADNDGALDVRRVVSALAALTTERKAAILVGEIQTTGDVLLLSTALLRSLEHEGVLEI